MSKATLSVLIPQFTSLPLQNGLPLTLQTTIISGSVTLTPIKPISHSGVKIEILGYFIVNKEIKSTFFGLEKDIFGAEKTNVQRVIPFDFGQVQLPYSTGKTAMLEVVYCVKTTLMGVKNVSNSTYFERKTVQIALVSKPFKTEVGAENAIQIEIQTNNINLNLSHDFFVGSINFLLCQKKFLQLNLIFRSRGQWSEKGQVFAGNWTEIFVFQAMEGAPTRGEIVPFKVPIFRIRELFPSVTTDEFKVDWSVLFDVEGVDGQHYYKEVCIEVGYW